MSGPQLSRKYLLFLHDRAGHTRPLHSSYYELSTLDKLQRHPLRRFPGAAQRTDGVRGLAGRHAGGAGPAARCKRLLPHRFRRPCAAFRADGVLNRIDRIVVRWDLTERKISVAVKSSAPATSPVAPALQRDADAYELCLADVLVGAGVTAISQANITDRRLDGSLCGVVAGVVDQIDTDAFNAQLEAWFADYKEMSVDEFNDLVSYMESLELLGDQQYAALEAYMNDFKADAENDFNAWFATLQNVLDEDTAGHLLNLIQNNTARIEMLEAVLFNDITTNPFLILFDDLDGVTATGVWNAALQRIEC